MIKPEVFTKLSSALYACLSILILLILPLWEAYASKPLDSTVFFIALFLAFCCGILGYLTYRSIWRSFSYKRNLAATAGLFCGIIGGIGGWFIGLGLFIPLLIALFGMPELWKVSKNRGAAKTDISHKKILKESQGKHERNRSLTTED